METLAQRLRSEGEKIGVEREKVKTAKELIKRKVDIDIIMTGKPKSVRDKLHVILSILMGMEKETGIVEKSTLIG